MSGNDNDIASLQGADVTQPSNSGRAACVSEPAKTSMTDSADRCYTNAAVQKTPRSTRQENKYKEKECFKYVLGTVFGM